MAISKNSAAAADKEVPAPVKAAAAKTVAKDAAPKAAPAKTAAVKAPAKPAAKAETKADAKPAAEKKVAAPKAEKPAPAPKADTAPVEIEVEAAVKMSRHDVAEAIQAKVRASGKAIPLNLTEDVIGFYEEVISESLGARKEVNLPGFGKFVSVHRAGGERPNPKKPGEKVQVAAHYAPKFKPGAALKKAMNGGADLGEEPGDAGATE
jgi:nucleoid DNA-binding protein